MLVLSEEQVHDRSCAALRASTSAPCAAGKAAAGKSEVGEVWRLFYDLCVKCVVDIAAGRMSVV